MSICPENTPQEHWTQLAGNVALPVVLTSWVMADARKRGRRLDYDYDSFVYFAWPLLVPVYLFQTRGVRAFLTLLWFGGIWLCAAFVAGTVYFFSAVFSSAL
jgi:hypothetical protein